jgi:hypothetical protein
MDRFYKNIRISNFIKIPPMGAELFHADGWRDINQQIVAFRNFVNALDIQLHVSVVKKLSSGCV